MKSRSSEQVRASGELLALACLVQRAKEFIAKLESDPLVSQDVKVGALEHYLDMLEMHLDAKMIYSLKFGFRDNF